MLLSYGPDGWEAGDSCSAKQRQVFGAEGGKKKEQKQ